MMILTGILTYSNYEPIAESFTKSVKKLHSALYTESVSSSKSKQIPTFGGMNGFSKFSLGEGRYRGSENNGQSPQPPLPRGSGFNKKTQQYLLIKIFER